MSRGHVQAAICYLRVDPVRETRTWEADLRITSTKLQGWILGTA